MNRCRKFILGLLAVLVMMPSLAREPLTLALLKEKAAADAAGEQCRAAEERSESPEQWVLAIRIGANGYPTDALVSPDNEGLECRADRLKATQFIKPPHDGVPHRRKEIRRRNERLINPFQRTHSRVTTRAKHGSRHAARR